MREQDRKVYCLYPIQTDPYTGESYTETGSKEEYVLYDFSLNLYDTIMGRTIRTQTEYIEKLFDIKKIPINGKFHRVFDFGFVEIIEGVGCIFSILDPFRPLPICEPLIQLLAVMENETFIYGNNCEWSGLPENESKTHYTIRPVNSELIIEFPTGTFDQVDVVNMSAQTIDRKKINGTGQVSFTTDKYEPGVYLLVLQGKNNREVARIVVAR